MTNILLIYTFNTSPWRDNFHKDLIVLTPWNVNLHLFDLRCELPYCPLKLQVSNATYFRFLMTTHDHGTKFSLNQG